MVESVVADGTAEGSQIPITVEFTGGLEMLFSDQRKHQISVSPRDENGNAANVAFLIRYLCEEVMKDQRKDLFVLEETVRPGILVLINDADWELEGEETYELKKGDNILFVSTLHGG
ncbi:Ubiquitin- modifier 1 [Glutinoglossum americanum]|uniref:Ubiquitin-related modifier 1 n=1 Tax=Glutinoglossum americanum TaxID=1670608 RepID=A0A9P8L4K3_9PEZI|nr:Ubiquitin- modifier 1 [Glutinoglossum americanum]